MGSRLYGSDVLGRLAECGFLNGAEFSEILPPLNLLIAYDVIFIALPLMFFEYVVEE